MLTVFASYLSINILKGVHANTSNYLKFIGADDRWLDFQSPTLRKGYAVLRTGAKGIQAASASVDVLPFADTLPVMSERYMKKALCKRNGMQTTTLHRVMYNRSLTGRIYIVGESVVGLNMSTTTQ